MDPSNFNKELLLARRQQELEAEEAIYRTLFTTGTQLTTKCLSTTTHTSLAEQQLDLTPSNRVTIRDLVLSPDQLMTDKFFLCRNIAPNYWLNKLTALHLIVDDPEGHLGANLKLLNYQNTTRMSTNENVIAIGTVMAVKNPVYKRSIDAIYCDNPSNIVLLDETEAKVITWKTTIPAQYQPLLDTESSKKSLELSVRPKVTSVNERTKPTVVCDPSILSKFDRTVLLREHGGQFSPQHTEPASSSVQFTAFFRDILTFMSKNQVAGVQLLPTNQVGIKDLIFSLNEDKMGRFLLCRSIAPAYQQNELSEINLLIDDPEGKLAAHLVLYNYDQMPLKDFGETIPVGTILAVKNPGLYGDADGGYAIVIANSDALVFLDDTNAMKANWTAPIPEVYRHLVGLKSQKHNTISEGVNSNSTASYDEAEKWKSLGDEFFKEEMYDLSLDAYSRGLTIFPRDVGLLSNRCKTNLKVENFFDALQDADEILQKEFKHSKSLYRRAIALIGLRKYEEALTFLNGIPEQDITEKISKLKSRLAQQLNGIYDMRYFLVKEKDKTMKTYPNCAEYYVRTRVIEIPGKGRGTISEASVKAGQLIMVSKAFVFNNWRFEAEAVDPKSVTDSSYIPLYAKPNLVYLAAQKLKNDPDLCKEFYRLYAGPIFGYLEEGRYCNDVDIKRIDYICQNNAFQGEPRDGLPPSVTCNGSSGIWMRPSFLNHSCINYNAFWMIKKDFLFLRAIKDISENQEIIIPYISYGCSYYDRSTNARKANFECVCDLCLLERNEPQYVRMNIEEIVGYIMGLPEDGKLTKKEILAMQEHIRRLEIIRPEKRLNIPLAYAELMMAKALTNEKSFATAAERYENAYDILGPYVQEDAILAAAYCARCLLLSGRRERVEPWIVKWKQQLVLSYGCHTVELFEDVKELLQKAGMHF